MPIKGLSDRPPSFPRIGELRKGAVKPKAGNRPGADLNDAFRFTSNLQGLAGKFANEFPDKPNHIPIFLPYATTEENFDSWVEEWGSGGLKWRGDGENLVLWQTTDGEYSQEKKPQPKGGKAGGRLHVIIPALGKFGYVTVLTTSLNDIMEISGNLAAYETLRGDLRGIPLVLSRVPRMISTPPTKKNPNRVRREKWLIHIEPDSQWVQAQLQDMERLALPGIVQSDVMALPDGVDVETGEIVEDVNDVFFDAPATVAQQTPPRVVKKKAQPAAKVVIDDNGNDVLSNEGGPPEVYAEFLKWFAGQSDYYTDNLHVGGAVNKLYPDSNMGINFGNYDVAELIGALESYAQKEAK